MKKKLLVVVMALCGCSLGPTLVPDSTASVVTDTPNLATAEAEGVRVWVDGTAWRGEPLDLATRMTPLRVIIENRSTEPLRVAYRDFQLVGGSGFRYAAVAPLEATGAVSERSTSGYRIQPAAARHYVHTPRFHHRGFYVAPHYSTWYPGYAVWSTPFAYDPYGYQPYAWQQPLPTDDMIAEAMPEGAVEAGGSVDGFVYFQGVARREDAVRFELQLVDAKTQVARGTIAVPLRIRR